MSLNQGSYYGFWWLPESPDRKIKGILTFRENDDAEFFVTESLSEEEHPLVDSWKDYDLVLGLASSLETHIDYSFKLLFTFKRKVSQGVFTKHRYDIPTVLVAKLNVDEKATQFKSIMLSSPIMVDWIKMTGVSTNKVVSDDGFSMAFEYKHPEPILLYQAGGSKVYVWFRSSYGASIKNKVKIEEQPYINYEFPKPLTFTQCSEKKASIERLLMIWFEQPFVASNFDVGSIDRSTFQVFNNQKSKGIRPKKKFSFESFCHGSQEIIGRWLKLESELKHLIDPFFYAFGFSTRLNLSKKFQDYCFVLELYHRKRFRNSDRLSEKKKRMTLKALSEVNKDTRQWLEKVLNTERNIPLNIRLEELQDCINEGLFTAEESRRIRSNRHYYVHLDETYEGDLFNIEELVVMNEKLSHLMIQLLKRELT